MLDVSGSVAGSLNALKTAATTFTNSLVGTPSQVALFTFATTAPANATNNQNRPLTPVSTQAGADTVNAWIDGLTTGGGTNWDRGIFQVAQSATPFDVAVVITDGNPTFYGNQRGAGQLHPPPRGRERHLLGQRGQGRGRPGSSPSASAPASAAAPNNLISISGPTVNSDYFQTTDYTQAGTALRALALGSCQGTHLRGQAGRAEHGPSGHDDRRGAGRRLAVRGLDGDVRCRDRPDLAARRRRAAGR